MNKRNSGKYFRHVFILISIFVYLIFLTFSGIQYFHSFHTISRYARENNKQEFSQIDFNLSNLTQNIANAGIYLYQNPGTLVFMEDTVTEDESMYDRILDFRRLVDPIVNNNNSIHSIYIYNYQMKKFFSSYRNINYSDEKLLQRMKSDTQIPVLKPVYRVVEDLSSGTGYSQVLTYIYYEELVRTGTPKGAVIINVKYDWIRKNLDELNQIDTDSKGMVILLNQKFELLAGKYEEQNYVRVAAEQLKRRLTPLQYHQITYGEFSIKTESERYAVAYDRIEPTGWVIARIQPFQTLYQFLIRQIYIMVLITLLFSIAIFVISYKLSRNIYRPVNKLMTKLEPSLISDCTGDEFAVLSAAYDTMIGKLKKVSDTEHTRMSYLFFLKMLLLTENSIDEQLIQKIQQYHEELFAVSGWFSVCVLKIDEFHNFKSRHQQEDQQLIKYAVCNVLGELLSASYASEVIDMDQDELVAIIRISKEQRSSFEKYLRECIEKTLAFIKKGFEVSFTTVIGSFYDSLSQLPQAYQESKNHGIYRFLFGKESIITNNMVEMNDRNDHFGISEMKLWVLIRYMKSEEMDKVENQLKSIFEDIKIQNYHNIKNSLMILIANVFFSLAERNQSLENSNMVDHSEIYYQLLQKETCQEVFELLLETIQNYRKEDVKSTQKNELIISMVKKMIEKEYADPGFSLQQISSQLQMSDQYLGRVFKSATGKSVSDYMNEVRLKHAIYIMKTTKMSVAQVADEVGITSEGQFYRIFKKKFGMTPKSYITQCSIESES